MQTTLMYHNLMYHSQPQTNKNKSLFSLFINVSHWDPSQNLRMFQPCNPWTLMMSDRVYEKYERYERHTKEVIILGMWKLQTEIIKFSEHGL